MMQGWKHSGFNVFCGERIYPHQRRSIERLAAYLIRASFSQERMDYLPEEATVHYHSKDGKDTKTNEALEWIAAMGTRVPLRGEHVVRYYGEPIPSQANVRSHSECEPSRRTRVVKTLLSLRNNCQLNF